MFDYLCSTRKCAEKLIKIFLWVVFVSIENKTGENSSSFRRCFISTMCCIAAFVDLALYKTVALLHKMEQRHFVVFVCFSVCCVLHPTRSIAYHYVWSLTLCELLNPCYNQRR